MLIEVQFVAADLNSKILYNCIFYFPPLILLYNSFALYEMYKVLTSFSVISPVKRITNTSQLRNVNLKSISEQTIEKKNHAREIFEIANAQIVNVLFISCSMARVRK